jgi:hypothetical protein
MAKKRGWLWMNGGFQLFAYDVIDGLIIVCTIRCSDTTGSDWAGLCGIHELGHDAMRFDLVVMGS